VTIGSVRRAPFLTVNDVAERLRISTKTVRRWIDRRELHAHRFGRQIRISEDDLDVFLREHRE
jgi:excisionase family DNA binding protein